MLKFLFECIFLWYDYMRNIKEMSSLFNWMYIHLLWFYEDNQRRCCTFYLNVYTSDVILWRASKKVLHFFKWVLLWCDSLFNVYSTFMISWKLSKMVVNYFFICIFLNCEPMQNIKQVIALFIWMYIHLIYFLHMIKEGSAIFIECVYLCCNYM